jgi:hypothetical protein
VKRFLFNVLAGISLLLCAMVVAVGIRSWWIDDCATSRTDSAVDAWLYTIQSSRGTLDFTIARIPGHLPGRPLNARSWWLPWPWRDAVSDPEGEPAYPRALWFVTDVSTYGLSGKDMGRVGLVVPDWFFVVTTSALPTIWFWKRRSRPRGFCLHCGYDLRATPDRCPECGTAVECPSEAKTV